MRGLSDEGRRLGESEPLGPGDRVARYILGPRLGEGAMGVVFAAHDPELDRRVAIKLMHASSVVLDAEGRDHRLREAQATARLVHRNLVTIHDVGSVDGRLFVAMDLIDGPTLRQWLGTRRSWREIVAVLRAAGEGLAAAHDAGVLHLDFKPENVLLAGDGRVVVTDFGLASAERVATGSAKDDQRDFCETAFEALWGVPPTGPGTEAPSGRRIPRWLRRAVLRGLSPEPADRYPDMRALLAALLPPRRLSPRRVAAGAGTAAAAIAIAAWVWPPRLAQVNYCDRVVEHIEGVWNTERRDAIESAFLATREPAAADAWAVVSSSIDAFAKAWVDAQLEVCRIQQDGSVPRDTVTLRVTCLERQLSKATSLLDALAEADAQTVLSAASVIGGLGSPERCDDDEQLSRREVARAAIAPDVRRELDEGILRAQSLVDTAKFADAVAQAEATFQRARAVGDHWAAAEALLASATGHQWLADGLAEQAFHDTLSEALGGDHDRAAAQAMLGLIEMWSPGHAGGPERVEQWHQHCEAIISSMGGSMGDGDGDERLEVELAAAIGGYYQKSGLYDEAEAAYETVVARPYDGSRATLFANAYANLGGIAAAHGRFSEALTRFRQGEAILVEVFGPRHPASASATLNVGSALAELGDLEGAYVEHLRALTTLEANLGRDHPALAPALRMLAWNGLSRRRFAEALPFAQRALSIAQNTSRDDPGESIARSLAMLATIELELGRISDAFAHAQTALTLANETMGVEHPSIAEFEIDFALAASKHGDDTLAREHFARAIAMREAAMGAVDSEVGRALSGLAELELARGNHREAVAAATRAHDISRAATMERAVGRAEAGFLLARALMAGGDADERARARTLAEQARLDLVAAGPSWSAHVEVVEAWQHTARAD